MKALIIEDEIPAANQLKRMLLSLDDGIIILETLKSVTDSVNWLRGNPAPDIIFIDVELNDGRAFDIFEQLKVTSPVVFTTANDSFLTKAIKLNALDYLLKPYNKLELANTLNTIQQYRSTYGIFNDVSEIKNLALSLNAGSPPKKIALRTIDRVVYIRVKDIIRIQTTSGLSEVFTTSGEKITVAKTLKEYEELLSDLGFYRVNDSTIINAHV
ncbi:MAG TPA: LytTR family DNA-binding domain-containing protein [Bacteroidia bacterium]|nr:LytTR family DNA-binding domain-containing protein [Bacteroidia bacterium]